MAGNYTYEGFLNEARGSGLLEQFSQKDLETAQRYPEFGYSILSLKRDFGKATSDEERLLINQTANKLRSSYANYSGGADGSGYISGGKIPGQIQDTLDQIGSFAIPDDPTAAARQKQLDAILNRGEFEWSKEDDPLWSSYKKQYLREGERATANVLGQASTASGGRPSSYAVGAATQAGDYYATKLNDIIPALQQQAYNQYLQDYNMDLQGLQALNDQQSLWRQGWQDQLGVMESRLSALQGQDAIDYGRYLDEINLKLQQEERDYQRSEAAKRYQDEQEEKRFQRGKEAAALAAQGGDFSNYAALYGLSPEQAKLLQALWGKEQAQMDWETAYEKAARQYEATGDMSGFAGLNWDTAYLQKQRDQADRETALKEALQRLQYTGDVSGLAGLGWDPEYALKQLAQEQQVRELELQGVELDNQYREAQIAAYLQQLAEQSAPTTQSVASPSGINVNQTAEVGGGTGGTTDKAASGMTPSEYSGFSNRVNALLRMGSANTAYELVLQNEARLTDDQMEELQGYWKRYGLAFNLE